MGEPSRTAKSFAATAHLKAEFGEGHRESTNDDVDKRMWKEIDLLN